MAAAAAAAAATAGHRRWSAEPLIPTAFNLHLVTARSPRDSPQAAVVLAASFFDSTSRPPRSYPRTINWAEVLRHTGHKIGHFGDVFPDNLLFGTEVKALYTQTCPPAVGLGPYIGFTHWLNVKPESSHCRGYTLANVSFLITAHDKSKRYIVHLNQRAYNERDIMSAK